MGASETSYGIVHLSDLVYKWKHLTVSFLIIISIGLNHISDTIVTEVCLSVSVYKRVQQDLVVHLPFASDTVTCQRISP